MNFFKNMFFSAFFLPKIASVRLSPSISQKTFSGITFSDPQQFSELENFGSLGAGGGGDAR